MWRDEEIGGDVEGRNHYSSISLFLGSTIDVYMQQIDNGRAPKLALKKITAQPPVIPTPIPYVLIVCCRVGRVLYSCPCSHKSISPSPTHHLNPRS